MKIFAFADEACAMIDGQITAMKRNGLDGLEIRNVDQQNISDISAEKAAEVRKKLDDAGLRVWSVGSPIGKINIETDDFQKDLDKLRHTLELADILGTKNIRMFSFFLPKEKDPGLFRNQVMDNLSRYAEAAEGSGITLCHENEKGIYGDVAARCLDIHQQVPRLKAVFDPANFVQCGQDTLEAFDKLKPFIRYMHIKDALADGSVVPAGKGLGNLPRLLEEYRTIGDEVTLEPHLAVFDGLKELEQNGNTSHVGGYAYPSRDAAFDAACGALREIL